MFIYRYICIYWYGVKLNKTFAQKVRVPITEIVISNPVTKFCLTHFMPRNRKGLVIWNRLKSTMKTQDERTELVQS